MDLHRPTGAWYFRRLHQARAFTIGIILKFELLSVRSNAETAFFTVGGSTFVLVAHGEGDGAAKAWASMAAILARVTGK
jgi:hypothetical protein